MIVVNGWADLAGDGNANWSAVVMAVIRPAMRQARFTYGEQH